jgi:hypothetical protein
VHALVGFGLAALFMGAMLWSDPGGVGALILREGGAPVIALLWFFIGLTFGSVQIGAAIMLQDGRDDTPRGGRRGRVPTKPVAIALRVRRWRARAASSMATTATQPGAGRALGRGARHDGVSAAMTGATRRVVAVALGGGLLAACAADRAAPPADRYRCVVTPNDLVECTLVEDAGAPAPR